MLELQVGARRFLDSKTNKIVKYNGIKLQIEHSLSSIYEWEAKYNKPFLKDEKKSREETLDYIRMMTLNDVPDDTYTLLTKQDLEKISRYMENPMTATTIKEKKTHDERVITSEIIYSWMAYYHIPFDWDKRHFNQLMTLIRVCNIESQPAEKMSSKEAAEHQRALNKARRAKSKMKG